MIFVKNNLRALALSAFFVQLYIIITEAASLSGYFTYFFQLLILFFFFRGIKKQIYFSNIDVVGLYLTCIYVGWLFFQFCMACIYAEGYWVWKMVVNAGLLTAFHVVILLSTNPLFVQKVYRLFWKYFLPLFIISTLFAFSPLTLNYLPYSTLLLFWGLIPSKKKWWLLAIVCMFFVLQEQRNDMMKMLVAAMIGVSISYFYRFIPKWGFKIVHTILLVLPIVLLCLAVTEKFNVFKMDEYIKNDYKQMAKDSEGNIVEDDLKADTRTFIYVNVFYTLNKYDAWIMGRSPAYGDEGFNWEDYGDDKTNLKGRYGNEVQILNILLWYGIIGVILYFLIFIRASYLAIYKSKNKYVKGIGLYVSFLWVWSFVWEVSNIETYYMLNIMFLGLCFSKNFRSMNESEMRSWCYSIFEKKMYK